MFYYVLYISSLVKSQFLGTCISNSSAAVSSSVGLFFSAVPIAVDDKNLGTLLYIILDFNASAKCKQTADYI